MTVLRHDCCGNGANLSKAVSFISIIQKFTHENIVVSFYSSNVACLPHKKAQLNESVYTTKTPYKSTNKFRVKTT